MDLLMKEVLKSTRILLEVFISKGEGGLIKSLFHEKIKAYTPSGPY